MGELKGAGQSLAGQLSSIPGPAGSVVQGVMGINSAFKILLAKEKLPFVGKYFKEMNEYSREAIELEKSKQTLAKRERVATEENAKIERDVSELRNKAKQKDLYNEQERIKFLKEAISLERKRADETLTIAKEKLRIAEAEAARAENTAETENQLAQLRTDVYNKEKEYHDRTRRLTSELSNFKIEQEKERKEAAKKAIEEQLKAVERSIAAEKAKLTQAKLDKEITQKKFNEKMEALELESLNRKFEIHGLEKDKRAEISQAIIDMKLKFLEEEEKLRLLEQYADKQLTQEEYQQALIDLEQQFLDEKLRINGISEDQITKLKSQQLHKQVTEQDKSLKKQEDRQKKYTQMFLNFAGNMSEALGEALTNYQVPTCRSSASMSTILTSCRLSTT